MGIHRSLNQLKDLVVAGSCCTIGNFDGVHLGHQTLVKRTLASARDGGLTSVVVTFDPHPLRVINGETPPFITPTVQKLHLLDQLGVDHILCQEFTPQLAAMSPQEFVKSILVDGLAVKKLVIGHDYAFGKARAGNYEVLKQLGLEYGFEVEKIDPVILEGDVVSSSRIRSLIQAGHVADVKPLLGRFYQVSGMVIPGKKRGGPLLGVPTANIKLVDELFPKPGVYAVWAEHEDLLHPAVANVGFNPTFGNDALSVEVHLLNFSRDLYSQTLKVHFVERLRAERKFSGVEELLDQIHKDIARAGVVLADPDNAITKNESRVNSQHPTT
jgi:riboflavin kinase/FMN adenylyltransferase